VSVPALRVEISPNAATDQCSDFFGHLSVIYPLEQHRCVCHCVLRKLAGELKILFPPGNVFGYCEVVDFQAQA
jgi:hypothetical protein